MSTYTSTDYKYSCKLTSTAGGQGVPSSGDLAESASVLSSVKAQVEAQVKSANGASSNNTAENLDVSSLSTALQAVINRFYNDHLNGSTFGVGLVKVGGMSYYFIDVPTESGDDETSGGTVAIFDADAVLRTTGTYTGAGAHFTWQPTQ